MKTWKKIAIAALCMLGIALVIIAGFKAYDYCKPIYYDYNDDIIPDRISDNILMFYGYDHKNSFVRLKDLRTGKYTTPKLQHIFTNRNNTLDSLVVFRTLDYKRGYLNIKTGQIVIPAIYNRAWNFSEGLAAVFNNGEVSFITPTGERAFAATFPIHYDDNSNYIAFQFHGGYCVMRTLEDKWGLINTQGEWVVQPVYNSIDAPILGYRKVIYGTKCGLLTLDGKLALPLEYDDIHESSDSQGLILVKDGYAKKVDKEFNTIIPFIYDRLSIIDYIHNNNDEYEEYNQSRLISTRYWRYDLGYNSGVIDSNGNVIIPAIYYNVYMVNKNLFEVETTYCGERILFNTKGQQVGGPAF